MIIFHSYVSLPEGMMWVKRHKPSPSHHHFYRWYKPFPNGWLYSVSHIHNRNILECKHVLQFPSDTLDGTFMYILGSNVH